MTRKALGGVLGVGVMHQYFDSTYRSSESVYFGNTIVKKPVNDTPLEN